MDLFSHTYRSFIDCFPKGKVYAGRLYSSWMRKGDCSDVSVEPQARSLFARIMAEIHFYEPDSQLVSSSTHAKKFVTKFDDGLACESVILQKSRGTTLCVSSQVGCKRGCAFCETGRMGLKRNLRTSEIIAQFFLAKHVYKSAIRNVVFMGMGEPLDNLSNVLKAIDIMTDERGLGVSPSRITVSTSGVVPQIYSFTENLKSPIKLAISVNAPSDIIRQKIMPVNRRYPLHELKKAMLYYCKTTKQKIFIEYVLLSGVNDSEECAYFLLDYLQGVDMQINLIPYNSQESPRFCAPSRETVYSFAHILRMHNVRVFIREEKGADIMAACGQLRRNFLEIPKSLHYDDSV